LTAETPAEALRLISMATEQKTTAKKEIKTTKTTKRYKARKNLQCSLCLKEFGKSKLYNPKGLNPHLRMRHNIGGRGVVRQYGIKI